MSKWKATIAAILPVHQPANQTNDINSIFQPIRNLYSVLRPPPNVIPQPTLQPHAPKKKRLHFLSESPSPDSTLVFFLKVLH